MASETRVEAAAVKSAAPEIVTLDAQRRCVSCSSLIPEAARICSVCKSYQNVAPEIVNLDAQERCIGCRSLISKSARICPVCKSYQNEWRNNLIYLGGIAGFITVVASAGVFLFNQSYKAYQDLTWTDTVTISELRYPGDVLITNSGEGTVDVTSIEFYWHGESYNQSMGINLSINSHSVGQKRLDYVESRFTDKGMADLKTRRISCGDYVQWRVPFKREWQAYV